MPRPAERPASTLAGPSALLRAGGSAHGPPAEADDRRALRLEAVLVGITLAGLVLGVGLERVGVIYGAWGAFGVAYLAGGTPAARAGLASLAHGHVDVDVLMVLAALGALVVGAPSEGATLLFLFALSNYLQRVALGRSRRAIRALMELRPDVARVRRDGAEIILPVEEIAIGEVYAVLPGERLPLDGVVVDGLSDVDQSTLTGESVPVDRGTGDDVFAGTLNGAGALEVRVTRPAGDSALARMVRLVEEAQEEKAGAQRLIDRFESPYAIGVLVATALAVVIPVLILDHEFAPSFYRAMTLMVAASPCAVVIATPAAMLSAIAAGGRQGVLFKGGGPVEAAAAVRAVAFDKTGTLTEGATRLTDAVPVAAGPGSSPGRAVDADTLLAVAAAVQRRSEHHLARATADAASARGLEVPTSDEFRASPGFGVSAVVAGRRVFVGNRRQFAGDEVQGWARAIEELDRLEAQGMTAVAVVEVDGTGGAPSTQPAGSPGHTGENPRALGVLAFADRVRSRAPGVVAALRRIGVDHVVLITGDNETVAREVGRAVGIDEIYAAALPERKVEIVRELHARHGAVAMVGDGVNDAPALAAATLGVAMGGAGTDVALEAADLVLMGDDLTRLPYALALGRAARRTVAVSLAFALGVVILLAATVLIEGLSLPAAVVGHEGSTVLVALNGLRLLAFRE